MNSAFILVGLCEHQYLKQTVPPFFLLSLTNVTSDCAAAYLADPGKPLQTPLSFIH